MGEPQLNLFGEPTPAPTPESARRSVTAAPAPLPASPAIADVTAVLAAGSAACATCRRCGLYEEATQAVYGQGNPQAKLMLVGEGPGSQEDATGQAFVGPAGQLLTKILASVGFDREQDCYISNVVKHRPPGNRVPTPEEMAACKPYLDEQITAIDPAIILLLGATALKGVLDRTGITKLRGEWIEHDGRWYMPVFHPSFLLRNASREAGSPKWLTWQDMQKVRRKYDDLVRQG
jgi:DNA polymerase